jgi:hypothetical protein
MQTSVLSKNEGTFFAINVEKVSKASNARKFIFAFCAATMDFKGGKNVQGEYISKREHNA